MTCLNYMHVKAVNAAAPRKAFIPCGKCAECRKQAQNGWAFRLSVEMDNARSNGYSIGFITLTYRAYPTLPKQCFTDPTEYKRVPCFSRDHIRALIHHLQDKIYDSSARGSKMLYMVCSEYGSYTRRPHYHAVFAVPPGISSELFHSWIARYWNRKHGYVIPRKPEGGIDKKCHFHKPFKVEGTARNVAKYAAKYCCKDMYFTDMLAGYNLDRKCRAFKNSDCFHVQSRSLGLSLVKKMTDAQKLDVLIDGYPFVGEDYLQQVPVYIRNKICFDPRYIVDAKTGKRLVRRDCTLFFKRHYKTIFERKTKFYEKLLNDCGQSTFYVSRGVEPALAQSFADANRSLRVACGVSGHQLAEDYLAYFGVNKTYRYDVERSLVWFNRYFSKPLRLGHRIDDGYYERLDKLFAYMFSTIKFINIQPTRDPALQDEVADFWSQSQ